MKLGPRAFEIARKGPRLFDFALRRFDGLLAAARDELGAAVLGDEPRKIFVAAESVHKALRETNSQLLCRGFQRGWESKSVEAQQEEAARQSQRAFLMLARTRALSDLQLACAPALRAMLEQAVADLDEQLGLL